MLKKSSKGFTLVELLVVIAIIGILATLATISLNAARSKARDAKRISDLKQMATAMELWNTDNNTYTGGCNALAADEGVGDLTSVCAPNDYITWTKFVDPSAPKTAGGDQIACAATATGPCDYVIGKTTIEIDGVDTAVGVYSNGYRFCAYFENKNIGLGIPNGADAGNMVSCITQDGWSAGYVAE